MQNGLTPHETCHVMVAKLYKNRYVFNFILRRIFSYLVKNHTFAKYKRSTLALFCFEKCIFWCRNKTIIKSLKIFVVQMSSECHSDIDYYLKVLLVQIFFRISFWYWFFFEALMVQICLQNVLLRSRLICTFQ